jgi:hypothetical protein
VDLDITALLAFLKGIDPCAAAIGAVVLWLIQRGQNGKGFRPADILADILGAFSKGKPALPDVPKSEPVAPPDGVPSSSDRLLDELMDRLKARFKRRVKDNGGDDSIAVDLYSRIVAALKNTAVRDKDVTVQ